LYFSGTLPVGATVDVTGALAELNSDTALRSYFDGNVTPDATLVPAWTGTADASASTLSKVTGKATLSSNTASQPTFTAPYERTQQTYSFGLVVTDTGALSSASDTVVITVAPHPEWYHNGTTYKPELINFP
jgi:hypothetical protein